MAPLAVLYKKMGWKVTGSDRAFFPPMSTYLEKNGIAIMPGFKAAHLEAKPDMVLVMAFITGKNPEVIEAKKLKIPVKVYADVLPGLIERENSIVIAGDCGKTSTAALVTWLLETAGHNPSFMIGGLPRDFEHGIRRTRSAWSVMEGDEYPASNWDNTPRFLYYNPKYLILTDVSWDHMDKFPTEKIYISMFEKLVAKVPKDGIVIANREGRNVKQVVKNVKAQVVFYDSLSFKNFPTPFKGNIWRQNSAAAIVLARCLEIDDTTTRSALKSFSGIKRRQEVRAEHQNVVVIDDNAHTPIKVAGCLDAISKMFPKHLIYAIYEPGNRSRHALAMAAYKSCFEDADAVILPRVSAASEEVRDFNKKLAKRLMRYYKNCKYIESDDAVLLEIKKLADRAKQSASARRGGRRKKKIAFVFMSQKGFRGMIDETTSLLQ